MWIAQELSFLGIHIVKSLSRRKFLILKKKTLNANLYQPKSFCSRASLAFSGDNTPTAAPFLLGLLDVLLVGVFFCTLIELFLAALKVFDCFVVGAREVFKFFGVEGLCCFELLVVPGGKITFFERELFFSVFLTRKFPVATLLFLGGVGLFFSIPLLFALCTVPFAFGVKPKM